MDREPEYIASILIVDDDERQMRALCEILHDQGYATVGFTNGAGALNAIREASFDILLTDLSMPGMNGVELLAEVFKLDSQIVGILLTGQGSIETAVAAMKAGALDYVLKPVKLSAIQAVLARAVSIRRLRRENMDLRNTVAMHELNQAIAYTLDPVTLLDKIARAALAQFEADETSVMLLEDPAFLSVAAVAGKSRHHLIGEKVKAELGVAGWVAKHQKPLVFEGAINDPRFDIRYPRPEIQSSLCVPMITRNRLIGVLCVNCISKRQAFTQGQVKVSSIFTNAAAAGVEAARMYASQHKADSRYREILKMAADAIVSIDSEQKIVVFNRGAEDLFGYSADEVFGQSIDLLLPLDAVGLHRSQVVSFNNSAQHTKTMTGRAGLRGRRKDGTVFNAEIGISRHSEDGKPIFTAVVRDISDRQQKEIALRAAEVAESANLAKSLFLATMSHELRTPLSAIIGYSEILAEDIDAQSNPDSAEMLARIQTAGHHLLALINNVLDFSKIEAGKMEMVLETIDIKPFVIDIAATVKPLIEKNGNVMVVEVDEVASIQTDATRLRQLLFNLLSNAAKFTAAGEISLRVWHDHKGVFFQVRDSGIGMTPEQIERLFDPFVQADAKISRKYGGTGLGLAISWQIAELLGGEINVESNPGQGSVFTLRIDPSSE